MDWSWTLTNLAAAFLLPPLSLFLLGFAGLRIARSHPRLGHRLFGLTLLALWLLSTPLVAEWLLSTLTIPYRPLTGQEADAIVILGGGTQRDAPEFGGDTLNSRTLMRVRYGAWLYKRIGKPVLVTGGALDQGAAEGPLMRAVLEREFGVPVSWTEDRSRNTRENARFSAPQLRSAGIRRIFLVSHVWHLPRAIPEFEQEGFEVVPAGMAYPSYSGLNPVFALLPSPHAMTGSYYALHEWIGLLWYRFRR